MLIKREIIEKNIAIIKINRPEKANALNSELFIKLKNELENLENDDKIKVIIITGEGKYFCSGIDLKERVKKSQEVIFKERESIIRPFYLTLGNISKPTIASLNGPAFGGGAELALTCDLRIACYEASFSQSEIKWGMIPSCGACQRLKLIAGIGVAKDIIFTGRKVTAEEAFNLGIYNRLVKKESLIEETINYAKEISQNSLVALQQAKKAIEVGNNISDSLNFDFEASLKCFFFGDALKKYKKFE